ncbi:hypothetical protein Presley_87 [Acinetobacter phage Presley]|uniref:Uncharacterized protein n=1 Tax=Acinetobacter phage Presley TaxID=1406780 RepID=U5PW57_9CAUD|nr:hypothetical protein Presley_87 [Acinetobacter phage Presley]AGY48154.1 hypothetical protein Presley_87 [Acinetobacter phage Presley]
MTNFTPEELHRDAEALKHNLALGVALSKLKNIPEFRAIVEEYTRTQCLNLTKEKALLVKQGLNADNLQQQIDATAFFSIFLDTIEANFESAKVSLTELNNEE